MKKIYGLLIILGSIMSEVHQYILYVSGSIYPLLSAKK